MAPRLEFIPNEGVGAEPRDVLPDTFLNIRHAPQLDGVDGGPVRLIGARLDVVPDLLVRRGEGAAVAVVDDGDLAQLECAVEEEDVAEGVSDVAACVAVDDGFYFFC